MISTRRKNLENISQEFYRNLYEHKEMAEPALREVLYELPVTFTADMNWTLSQEIIERDLAIYAMAKRKAPGHYGIRMEFFQLFWTIIDPDFFFVLYKKFEDEYLHKEVTK